MECRVVPTTTVRQGSKIKSKDKKRDRSGPAGHLVMRQPMGSFRVAPILHQLQQTGCMLCVPGPTKGTSPLTECSAAPPPRQVSQRLAVWPRAHAPAADVPAEWA